MLLLLVLGMMKVLVVLGVLEELVVFVKMFGSNICKILRNHTNPKKNLNFILYG